MAPSTLLYTLSIIIILCKHLTSSPFSEKQVCKAAISKVYLTRASSDSANEPHARKHRSTKNRKIITIVRRSKRQ